MNFNKKVNMNNINKKFGKMGLIFLISVLIFSCFNNKEKVYTETVDGLFDTVHVISGYDKSEQEFKKKVKFYQEEMEKAWVNELRKRYKVVVNDDVVATVNKHN